MQHHETLSHTKWDCKCHVVFIPKDRCKALYKEWRQHVSGSLSANPPALPEVDAWEGRQPFAHTGPRHLFCMFRPV
jgi:hypothetical protein